MTATRYTRRTDMDLGFDGRFIGGFLVGVIVVLAGILAVVALDRRDTQRTDTDELATAVESMSETGALLDDIMAGDIRTVGGVDAYRSSIWRRSATSGLPWGADLTSGQPLGPVSMPAATPISTRSPAPPTFTPEYGLCLATSDAIRERLMELAAAQRYQQLRPQCHVQAPYGSGADVRTVYEQAIADCDERIRRDAAEHARDVLSGDDWDEALVCEGLAEE